MILVLAAGELGCVVRDFLSGELGRVEAAGLFRCRGVVCSSYHDNSSSLAIGNGGKGKLAT